MHWQPLPKQLELFVTTAGTFANSFEHNPVSVGINPKKQRSDFPVDMSFNAGVRIDTQFGLFSLTLAHIFNFVRE